MICPPRPHISSASTMFAAASSSPNVSQLLDLHRESLARFDEVTLVQTLVNGRKVLTLTIGVPVDERRTAKRPAKSSRKKEKEMERLRAWRERKRHERVMTSSPPPVPPPQSPLPRDIPQLDGDASISNDGRYAEDRSDARDRSDHDVEGNDDAVDRRDHAVDRRDDAVDRSDDAVDGSNAVDGRNDAVDGSDDAVGGSNDAMDLGDTATDVSDAPDPSTVPTPVSTATLTKGVRFMGIPRSEFLKEKKMKNKSPIKEK